MYGFLTIQGTLSFKGEEGIGYWKYKGKTKEVVIPEQINDTTLTSYYKMFSRTLVTKVTSTNKNVTDMSYMFFDYLGDSLDLSSFNTSNVTDMSFMFSYSKASSLDLSSFDTSNVTNMSYMVSHSETRSIDLSSFDTSNVTNMSGMFYLSKITKLNLSSFNTSNVTVTDMRYMFRASPVTTGYARTQEDADKFNSSFGKPTGLTFTVR